MSNKPLTIGIDTRYLRAAKTGTKTYLEELCHEFKKMDANDLRFYFLDTRLPPYSGNNKAGKLLEHFRYQLWKQLVLPVKALLSKCDVVFCTDDCVPLLHLGYKTIPVFHDAFCFEIPENYSKAWLWLYKHTAIPAAKRSAFVIAPTRWSKKQIMHYTHIDESKIRVVYEGPKSLSDESAIVNTAQFLASYGLTANDYLLHVGSMFKRKNIPALVDAFKEISIAYPSLNLVLAGPRPVYNSESGLDVIILNIKKNGLEDKVIFTGYLPDQELSVLYTNALLYVFPSVNEGFGIPVLEAFKHDLPVLVANNTCLPEVGGNAVLQFDPFDNGDMVLKIRSALENDSLRKEMIKKGRERLQDFSWQQTAAKMVEIFTEAV